MTTPTTKTLTFSVLVEKQQGAFVGHCLETGLVAAAMDESDVLSKMGKLIVRQVTFAIENNRLRDIYHSAPQEIWDKWIKTEERIIDQSRRAIPIKGSGGSKPRFTVEQTAYAAAC
jgi:hypothetical protein